jgi:hypothetical protein
VITDFLIMPLADSLYAFLFFTLPYQIYYRKKIREE